MDGWPAARAPRSASAWLALAGLIAALALGALARWIPLEHVEDLRPRPDALEYEEGARNLLQGEGYWVIIGADKYPPRYPFGFPALLLPVLWAYGDVPGSGVRAVLACALATIVGAWWLGLRCGGPASAAVAALLIALAPFHVRLSQQILSDVPAAAATTGLAAGMLAALRRQLSDRAWFALGVLAGLAATIRTSGVVVLVAATFMLLVVSPSGRVGRRRVLALAAGAAVGVLPMLAYNTIRFGSPLTTGYHWWTSRERFAWRYAFDRPVGGGSMANATFYLRAVAGLGELYPWPIAVLGIVGAVQGLRRPGAARALALLTLGLIASLVAFQSAFFWQGARFLLPMLPLCAVLAALPFGASSRPFVRAAALPLLAVAIATVAHTPHLYEPPIHFGEVATLREIDDVTEPNAALLANTTASFFDRFLRRGGADRVWVPLRVSEHMFDISWRRKQPYVRGAERAAWIRQPLLGLGLGRLDPEQVAHRVTGLMEEGRPVYLSTLLDFLVPYMADLRAFLGTRFGLEPVPSRGRWQLFRVRTRPSVP
jgi:hypothetical protein